MKKALILSIVLPLAGFLNACETHQKNLAQTQGTEFAMDEAKMAPGTNLGQRKVATGFFVTDDGYFITNYHVVQGASQIFITTAKGERVPARVVSENRDIDIVLAKANVTGRPVKLGTQQGVAKGEGVLTLGYPLMVIQGREQKATFGRINAFSGIRGDPAVYQIDVPVQPGNSGGPLISENGVVIGVIKATFNQMAALETIGTITQNINYAVKTDQIMPMLTKALGNQLKIGNSTKNRHEMPQLINKYEKSIVLVEAE